MRILTVINSYHETTNSASPGLGVVGHQGCSSLWSNFFHFRALFHKTSEQIMGWCPSYEVNSTKE